MPNSQTPNYGLSQWVREDKVLMEDFNADNTKIDAALKAGADARAAMAATLATRGNCRILYGSYTGSGLAGEANPNTLAFDGKPVAVFLLPPAGSNGTPMSMFLLRGAAEAFSCPHYPDSGSQVTWAGNSVSWYSYTGNAIYQFSKRSVYTYVALLAADE